MTLSLLRRTDLVDSLRIASSVVQSGGLPSQDRAYSTKDASASLSVVIIPKNTTRAVLEPIAIASNPPE